jgi:hypothetical protein
MTTLPMKSGDRLPEIATQLIGPDGVHLNLTGCTVTFTMRTATGRVLINRATATITQETQGRVKYVWQAGDTAVIGTHDIEWIVTYPGGLELTVPNQGYDKVTISARLT